MTITFTVCDKDEELFNLQRRDPFKIKDFIENKINGSYGEEPDSFQLWKEFEKDGLSYEESKKRVDKKKKEFEKDKEKFVKGKIEKQKVLGSSIVENVNKIIGSSNSFIYSAWDAYNYHHHLEIRPDNIWMAIISQFSLYLNKYNKELQDKFIDFQIENNEKKELKLYTDYPILDAPFDKLVMDMVEQIGNNIKDPSIKDWIIADFSTTTPNDKIAYGSVLMSITQKYFYYSMRSRCGLPKVTLNGSVEDWINLKERVIRLKEFNNKEDHMNKWLTYLLPVLDNFIQSSKGNPDKEWWNKIVDYRSRSGGGILTGWLSVFCVFDNDGNFQDSANTALCLDNSESIWPKVCETDIPYGYTSTPILLTDFNGTKYNSTIYSGHLTQKIKGSKLSPSIDWFIVADLSL
ncbi:hypothetical protein ACTFIZ_003722 [Dictyostelium cf. discoideum]